MKKWDEIYEKIVTNVSEYSLYGGLVEIEVFMGSRINIMFPSAT